MYKQNVMLQGGRWVGNIYTCLYDYYRNMWAGEDWRNKRETYLRAFSFQVYQFCISFQLKKKKIETILCWQALMPDSPVISIFLQILLLLRIRVFATWNLYVSMIGYKYVNLPKGIKVEEKLAYFLRVFPV